MFLHLYCLKYLSPSKCRQECTVCHEHFRTSSNIDVWGLACSKAISDTEARKMIRTLVHQITEDREHLNHQCQMYGGTVARRWKKSVDAREKYLLAAGPTMYPTEWCEARFLIETENGASEIWLRVEKLVLDLEKSFISIKQAPLPYSNRDESWIGADKNIREKIAIFWNLFLPACPTHRERWPCGEN